MGKVHLASNLSLPASVVTETLAGIGRKGCHRKGQLLLMFDGTLKVVEDIQVGDRLMGPDSEPRTVLALIRGQGSMAEVRPRRGAGFVVNEDHVLTLRRVPEFHRAIRTIDGQPKKRSTGHRTERSGEIVDVSVREWRRWSTKQKSLHNLFHVPVNFGGKAEPLTIDPYLLGVLLGDGHMVQRVSVTTMDPGILSELRSQSVAMNLRLRTDLRAEGCPSYTFAGLRGENRDGNPLAKKLSRLGLMGCRSGDKFIPQIYKTASRKDRLSLLAGLLDTDGHLGRNVYDFISKSARLASDVAFLARSLGFFVTEKACQKRDQNGHGGIYHRLCISGDMVEIPCRLERKRATKRTQRKDPLVTSFELHTLPEEDYYGFTLDRDGRYLLDDFTVTHNSGKTYMAGVLFEQMFRLGAQCIVLDPVGPWHGLRLAADGKSPGLDIRILGGDHGDIPLEPGAGAFVAGVLVERNLSAVIDVSRFRKEVAKNFAADFAEEFFQLKKKHKSPVHLFLEEARTFVPQQMKSKIDVRLVGAFEDIVRLGRNYGIGCTMLDQRPQSVNKEVLSQVEILIAMQTVDKLGRKELEDWVRSKSVPGGDALEALATLQAGEAFVWSPGLLKTFARVKINKKTTYDSSATPEFGGKTKAVQPKPLDGEEMVKLRLAMKDMVEKAEKTDPTALQRRVRELDESNRRRDMTIADLNAQLMSANQALETRPKGGKTKIKVVEKRLISKGDLNLLERLATKLEERSKTFLTTLDDQRDRLAQAQQALVTESFNVRTLAERAIAAQAEEVKPASNGTPKTFKEVVVRMDPATRAVGFSLPRPPQTMEEFKTELGGDNLTNPEQRILNALAWMEAIGVAAPENTAVAFLAKYSPNTGGYKNTKSKLKGRGLISYGSGTLSLTPEGRVWAEPPDFERTTRGLQQAVLQRLKGPEQRVLVPLLKAYPKALVSDELAMEAGYSPNTGGFKNVKSRLHTLGLIDYPGKGMAVARDILFPT